MTEAATAPLPLRNLSVFIRFGSVECVELFETEWAIWKIWVIASELMGRLGTWEFVKFWRSV
ncbi:hypothetical protein CIW48_12490 [Methylobacterium sp. P1-11]|nr:hypothetical protein CIW48_12490 [Methylobacterium sp. P1-11]